MENNCNCTLLSINLIKACIKYFQKYKQYTIHVFFNFCLGSVNNSWKVTVNYSSVAPWMSKTSRRGQDVINTEYLKGNVLHEEPATRNPKKNCDVTQEDLLLLLHNKDIYKVRFI